MKKSRFTEEQIAFALRQAEGGAPARDVCRKMGVSEQTFYRWKKKYAGVGVAETRRLREIAGVHVTWGYQRIWIKLRREGRMMQIPKPVTGTGTGTSARHKFAYCGVLLKYLYCILNSLA